MVGVVRQALQQEMTQPEQRSLFDDPLELTPGLAERAQEPQNAPEPTPTHVPTEAFSESERQSTFHDSLVFLFSWGHG